MTAMQVNITGRTASPVIPLGPARELVRTPTLPTEVRDDRINVRTAMTTEIIAWIQWHMHL
jgi:hypothetical protein